VFNFSRWAVNTVRISLWFAHFFIYDGGHAPVSPSGYATKSMHQQRTAGHDFRYLRHWLGWTCPVHIIFVRVCASELRGLRGTVRLEACRFNICIDSKLAWWICLQFSAPHNPPLLARETSPTPIPTRLRLLSTPHFRPGAAYNGDADGSRGVGYLPAFVCVSVCFPARYLKNDATRIIKLDIQKCSTVSPGNPFILGSNGQRSRSQVTDTLPDMGLCTLMSAGFF